MTSATSRDVKEVAFVNWAAEKAFDALPPEVLERAETALSVLQNGGSLPRGEYEALRGRTLAGVTEIKLPWNTDEYRVYQVVEFDEVIFVLDAGMKKSPRGGQIPQEQVERLEARLAKAREAYLQNKNLFIRRFSERRTNRGEDAATVTPIPGR